VNARDAMPSGGKLAVRTFNVELDAEGATKVPGAHPGRYVVIEVGDTGAGMDRSTLLRIFEPFFTTKGVGKGTGLGLSTVFGIVKQSDGLIAVKSAIGQGTEFRIYLPRIEGEVALVQAPPLRVPRGFGRVLVVEDDAQVREVIRRLMVGRGYEVIVASGMAAALATLQAVDGEVRLVLSDVVMQGGDGVALARRVRETWPGIPALLMSGHTDHPAMSGRECRVLQKPFTPAQLDQALDEAMKSDDSGAQVSASWATGAQPAARQKDCA
jgi:CheY-like chemotaxis protein